MTSVNHNHAAVEVVLKQWSHNARVERAVAAPREGHRDRAVDGKLGELPTASLDRVKVRALVPAALRVFRVEQRLHWEENQAAWRGRYDRRVSALPLALATVPLWQFRPAQRGLHRHAGTHVIALGLGVPSDIGGHNHPETHAVTRPQVPFCFPEHSLILAETQGEAT